jgi:hypothetical protein
MLTSSPRRPFTTWQIAGAPALAGVYVLCERDEVIYIGATRGETTIRARLQEHYARRAIPHDATHFSFEVCARPAERELELLQEFQRAHARLPRCNAGFR